MDIMQQPSLNLESSERLLLYELNFQLGKAYKETGELDLAIKVKSQSLMLQHLTIFLELCKKTGNHTKEGWAKVILASCYERYPTLLIKLWRSQIGLKLLTSVH